jgi:hypothetical protein
MEYDAQMRTRQEEFEEKMRQQKAGFDSTILEIQQKYAQDLDHEQKAAAEKFSAINQQHKMLVATSDTAFRHQLFESHQKIAQAESRLLQVEKENAQLLPTIELLRNDAARFQDARRAVGNQVSIQPQAAQSNLQNPMQTGSQINQLHSGSKSAVRIQADERVAPVSSLRTTAAAEAANHRRRVTQVVDAGESTDSDLEDIKQSKAAKRKKVHSSYNRSFPSRFTIFSCRLLLTHLQLQLFARKQLETTSEHLLSLFMIPFPTYNSKW